VCGLGGGAGVYTFRKHVVAWWWGEAVLASNLHSILYDSCSLSSISCEFSILCFLLLPQPSRVMIVL